MGLDDLEGLGPGSSCQSGMLLVLGWSVGRTGEPVVSTREDGAVPVRLVTALVWCDVQGLGPGWHLL